MLARALFGRGLGFFCSTRALTVASNRWLQQRAAGFKHIGLTLTLPVRARPVSDQEDDLHRKSVSLFAALMGDLAQKPAAKLKITLTMDGMRLD